jgi:hypothetical protein
MVSPSSALFSLLSSSSYFPPLSSHSF